ncbi:MAG TPA: hypothetical protein VJX67_07810, partial [Blastocatellia bacterium]|nr:hypothetical protein [Blastocatellia bacterium]
MVELFVNPKIDWIAAKKYFIGLTIFLLVAGAISVSIRGFNLGVDFTGGTLMTVRFTEPHTAQQIRSVLSSGGIDTSKVVIVNDRSHPTDLLIRAPELGNEAEHRVDETKRLVIKALQKMNPAGEAAAGKVNINTTDSGGIEQELRQSDPLGIAKQNFSGPHPYAQVGNQIVAFRDGQDKGFVNDISELQGISFSLKDINPQALNFDQAKVKAALMQEFY